MANKAYNRSVKRERERVNYYRAMGWDSSRSAGSKGKWDLFAYNPHTGQVILEQIKTKKGGRTMKIEVLKQMDGNVITHWITYG